MNDDELMSDILEWDVRSWSRAVGFWDERARQIAREKPGFSVLDLGARGGGISLYWALLGASVVCSDAPDAPVGPEQAKALHEKYGIADRVRYEPIDATGLRFPPFPYEGEFDVVTFKSLAGGLGDSEHIIENQVWMFENIYRALKPGGYLFFCENLTGCGLHMAARRLFTDHVGSWHYLTVDQALALADRFESVDYQTFGLLSIFGRGDISKATLCAIDEKVERFTRPESRYILSAICQK